MAPDSCSGLTACLEQGYERDLECGLLTKDRREVPVLINASLITDPQGRPLGVIGVIRDITALRRAETALEAERRRLLSLLEELPAYVYLKAPDYSIKFANRFFRERIGNPATGHAIRCCTDSMPPVKIARPCGSSSPTSPRNGSGSTGGAGSTAPMSIPLPTATAPPWSWNWA